MYRWVLRRRSHGTRQKPQTDDDCDRRHNVIEVLRHKRHESVRPGQLNTLTIGFFRHGVAIGCFQDSGSFHLPVSSVVFARPFRRWRLFTKMSLLLTSHCRRRSWRSRSSCGTTRVRDRIEYGKKKKKEKSRELQLF